MAKRGRPRGSKTQDRDVVDAAPPTACKKCGSTDREDYSAKTVQEYAGLTKEGRPYRQIILRPTRCLHCGQARIDRAYE